MNLTQQTIKAGYWQLLAVIARVILQLMVLAVLARYVFPEEFGYLAMANIAIIFIDMFADAGIGSAIVQKEELTEKHIRAGFFLSIFLGIFFVLILWFSAPFIAMIFKVEDLIKIIQWIGLSVLVTKIGSVSRSRIERDMRFDILMWVDVGSYLFGYALIGILLAVQGFGVWSIVAGKITQSFLQTGGLLIIKPHSVKPLFSAQEYKELLTYGGGLTLARIFDNIASQGDYFIVGRFLGSASLGFYERASSLMSMLGQYLNLVLDKALFPAMSQVQNHIKKLEKAYFTATNIISTVLIPLTILTFLLAPEIIAVLLGPQWKTTITPFRILLLTAVFRICMSVSDTLVRATGAVYASALRKAILVFFILLGSWIGHFWGLYAVAAAMDIAIIIGFILMLHLSITILKCKLRDYLKIFKNGFLIGGLLLLITFPIASILRYYCAEYNFLILFTTAATGCCITILVLLLFPGLLGKSGMESMRQIKESLINNYYFPKRTANNI